ncbi:MAG: hypothetical protein ABR82_05515 [Verrucomicrobia subdivision 6 bacterium BACL9 MAG-120507-bin52]|jgi:hypothetical protein|uniref:Uncharacterized protein n=1 Tax=Verrucomicrobia subdivision 6 bacterium BACL9 MAG-120507-bin52 TaxID=1655590 RepID=A0A0R2RHC9_9BACT|nr:MAG: hypothetical protein ABR82_05515 [Verrucomicrobia subdivision 6 bacterium BACL9 MAG-120507-bin52]
MSWREKGKGFLWEEVEGNRWKVTGEREQVEGGRIAGSCRAEGAPFHLPPFPCPLLLALG